MLEYVKAIFSWQTALIMMALAIMYVVKNISKGKGYLDLNFWDRLKINARGSDSSAQGAPSHTTVVSGTSEVAPNAKGEILPVPDGLEGVDSQSKKESPLSRFISAKTQADLEAAFLDIRSETTEVFDEEFWQTARLNKLHEIGAAGGEDDNLRELSEKNKSWIVPGILLMKRLGDRHDFDSAERILDNISENRASPHFEWALQEGIRLYYKMRGPRRAMQYCLRWIGESIADTTRASILFAIADEMKADGLADGYRAATEFALSYRTAKGRKRFDLAYSYGTSETRWPITIEHYRSLLGDDGFSSSSLNNIAVVFDKFDKAVGIDYYFRSVEKGNSMGRANAAQMLIDDGYIAAAEKMLEGVEDSGESAERIVRTKAQVVAARKKMIGIRDDIFNSSERQLRLYKSTLMQSYRNIQTNNSMSGRFVSDDESVQIIIEGEGAKCRLAAGDALFEGQLSDQLFCLSGQLVRHGVGLSDARSREATAFVVSEASLRLVLWPTSPSLDGKIDIIDLKKKLEITEGELKAKLQIPPTESMA